MDLAGLRAFLTVAAERSFSRAAIRLCRSQPAVSLAVQRLEEELGASLFDRTSRGGRLTPAGEVLQDYGTRVLRLIEETTTAVRDAGQTRHTTVTIGAEERMLGALAPLVAALQEAHPEVQVEVQISPATRLSAVAQPHVRYVRQAG